MVLRSKFFVTGEFCGALVSFNCALMLVATATIHCCSYCMSAACGSVLRKLVMFIAALMNSYRSPYRGETVSYQK